MRNVVFGIMLSALGMLQIAIVTAALSDSNEQTVSVAKSEIDTRFVTASTHTNGSTPAL